MFIHYFLFFILCYKYSLAPFCEKGLYGKDCTLTCSPYCEDMICRRTDGVCPNGCIPGYHGGQCDKVGCAYGWFGNKCQFLCHCDGNTSCSRYSGDCEGGCAPGWFGPACQYVSLKYTPDRRYLRWLVDNDESTCNYGQDKEGVLIIRSYSYPLTWIRIVHAEAENADDIRLTYQTVQYVPNGRPCERTEKAKVDDRTLDIMCVTNLAVKKLEIGGPGFEFICHIYISGGRNVALKQETHLTSWEYRAKLAVDGNDGTNFENVTSRTSDTTCTTSNRGSNEYWEVRFKWPVEISAFNIYNRPDCCWHFLRGFTLQALDSNSHIVFNHLDTLPSKKMYEVLKSSKIPPNVTTVMIRKAKTSQALRLCEVVVFGDVVCPSGKFGRECERDCNCLTKADCFVATGSCPPGCMPGYVGEACWTPCTNNTWGLNCAHQCSDLCLNGSCHHVTGDCLDCPPKYLLPDCKSEIGDYSTHEPTPFEKVTGSWFWLIVVIISLGLLATAPLGFCRLYKKSGINTVDAGQNLSENVEKLHDNPVGTNVVGGAHE